MVVDGEKVGRSGVGWWVCQSVGEVWCRCGYGSGKVWVCVLWVATSCGCWVVGVRVPRVK